MFHASTHRPSLVLHLTLALIIGLEGMLNLMHGLSGQRDSQLIAFGAAEAIGAVFFVWPRTMRVGACVLVCTFLIAAVVHVLGRTFPSEHLIYVVAVLFVVTHVRPRHTPSERITQSTSSS